MKVLFSMIKLMGKGSLGTSEEEEDLASALSIGDSEGLDFSGS